MYNNRFKSHRNSCHSLITVVLLVSVSASWCPLPLSVVSLIDKCQSQAYPCRNRPCGCGSAEQCWRQCCCFTNAEKMAWAQANGVQPPAYVAQAAQAELTICAVESEAADDQVKRHRPSEQRKCCESSGCDREQRSGEITESDKKQTSGRFVSVVEMLKCRGLVLFWNSLSSAVMTEVQMLKFPIDTDRWDVPRSDSTESILADPPEPPPRLA